MPEQSKDLLAELFILASLLELGLVKVWEVVPFLIDWLDLLLALFHLVFEALVENLSAYFCKLFKLSVIHLVNWFECLSYNLKDISVRKLVLLRQDRAKKSGFRKNLLELSSIFSKEKECVNKLSENLMCFVK